MHEDIHDREFLDHIVSVVRFWASEVDCIIHSVTPQCQRNFTLVTPLHGHPYFGELNPLLGELMFNYSRGEFDD